MRDKFLLEGAGEGPEGPREPGAEPLNQGIGEALRSRRQRLGLTLQGLAELAGCTKGYLSEIENGRRPPPAPGLLAALERALHMEDGELRRPAAWLAAPVEVREEVERLRGALLARGPRREGGGKSLDAMWRSGVLHRIGGGAEREGGAGGAGNVRPVECGARVPLINLVAAGLPAEFTDLGYPARVADEYVGCPDVGDPDAFAARVVGDSMEPRYREGDVVVFSPAREVRDGMDCFARLEPDHEATFKRVHFEAGEDGRAMIRLEALNPRYAPRVVERERVAGLYAAVRVVREIGSGGA